MRRLSVPLLFLLGIHLSGCTEDTQSPRTANAKPTELVQHNLETSNNASLSQDGRFALVSSQQKPAQLWDLQKNMPLFSWQNSKENTGIIASGFSPDGGYAATAERNNIALWDVKGGQVLSYWLMHENIRDLSVSQDGNYVLVGLENGHAEYIEMETGLSVRTFEHAAPVNSVALSDDGRYAATAADDKMAGFWDVQTGQPIYAWKFDAPVTKILISAKSRYVFTATSNGKIALFDRKTGQKIKSTFNNKGTISAAAFSPSEKYLVVHTLPEKITLWDVEKAKVLKTFSNPTQVLAVGFNRKENRIVTEDASGQGHQWELESSATHK